MRIAVLAYNLIGTGGLSVGRNVTAILPLRLYGRALKALLKMNG